MENIKSLFDKNKDIYRTIEKVITYDASQENRLKAEISEYVVTDSIEEQFEGLLTKMQDAMEAGEQNEIGVWVSGFYGSGKSSFTKYLGLAFDERIQIGGTPFLKHLQDRFHKPQTKALLSAISSRFPAAVVLLDLASEMLAGATMKEVSTVLYYKVLQWAGYSRNLKVAAFERKLRKDNRHEEFEDKIQADLSVEWKDVQNDPLIVDSIIPEIAHQMYPEIFKTETSFSTEISDFIQTEDERVCEMLDIVYEHAGKEHILFIIDEVGQYVGSRQNLILNLDGLAKNLKKNGDGKVWIVGTAQQTLTEDDPRASLNSPELFKLKDRFPIEIDLEPSDIKEICYKRLLGKSPEGEILLGELFEKHGQSLRHSTKLQDAKYYDSDFTKTDFINLYPFLPAHFDILLHLLGSLAKTTGGIGLRSAIKVVQDILIEGSEEQPPIAEKPVDWLATTVTLYDALEKDIRRAFLSIYNAVEKVRLRAVEFADPDLHLDVAKSVAVLQILGNLPVTVNNVSGLMHPGIETPSRRDQVESAVNNLISDSIVPFGEQDGNLCFFSEKLNDIELERSNVPLRSIETRKIFNEALKEVFRLLPSTHLDKTLAVTSGIKSQSGSYKTGLAGERETIQTIIEFVDTSDYDTVKTRLADESRHPSTKNEIYLLARTESSAEEKTAEIYRCHEICQKYRNEPDQEVKDYCNAQTDRATKLIEELQLQLKRNLSRGSFVFRGQSTAVDSLKQDLLEACKKYLADVAKQVFDKYSEAPVRVNTDIAEKFLRAWPKGITSALDPLSLIEVAGNNIQAKTDFQALISIKDYIDRNGTVEGKRLIENFTGAPYGWSQDTLRYLVAVFFAAGEIKLKVSGREVTANGQQAIDALKTNNTFKPIGIAIRDVRPSMEVCSNAAARLTEIIGDTVTPLEQDISEAAAKHFPHLQFRLTPIQGKLENLGLPGSDKIQSLSQEIADALFTDASDAPQRLGGEKSSLYDNLKWAIEVETVFKQGLEKTIQSLQQYRQDLASLPDTDIPGQLRNELSHELDNLTERLAMEDFYTHVPDLNSMLTTFETKTHEAAKKMVDSLRLTIKEAQQDLIQMKEWSELTREDQTNVLSQMESLQLNVEPNIDGLKAAVNQGFAINSRKRQLGTWIKKTGGELALKKEKERQKNAKKDNTLLKTVSIPSHVKKVRDLDSVLNQIEDIKAEAQKHKKIEISFKIEESVDE